MPSWRCGGQMPPVKMIPPAPLNDVNLYELNREERKQMGVGELPGSLAETEILGLGISAFQKFYSLKVGRVCFKISKSLCQIENILSKLGLFFVSLPYLLQGRLTVIGCLDRAALQLHIFLNFPILDRLAKIAALVVFAF